MQMEAKSKKGTKILYFFNFDVWVYYIPFFFVLYLVECWYIGFLKNYDIMNALVIVEA